MSKNTLHLPPQPQPRPSDSVHPDLWKLIAKVIVGTPNKGK
jgi:hypothetical protein